MDSNQPYLRFIPTPVGNMISESDITRTGTVHPHACGEHPTTVDAPELTHGSSPRLWGTWRSVRNFAGAFRFIPTPVGNIYCQ